MMAAEFAAIVRSGHFAAVEETVADAQVVPRVGAAVVTRPKLLAQLFNNAANSLGVAGTSGKSTTVGMDRVDSGTALEKAQRL